MKTKILAGLLLGASALAAAPRVAFGFSIGVPVRPVYVAPAPVYAPGPGYTWVAGFWEGYGPRRVWRPGYWAAPRARFEHRFRDRR
jgi:hypothetical protein